MRRGLYLAAFLAAVALLPAQAQMRGPSFGSRGFGPCCGNVLTPGGVAFGHNPRFHVFFGDPFFFRRRFFVSPFFFPQPVFVPVPVDGGSYPVVAEAAPETSDYAEEPELAREVERLRAEVEQLREESHRRPPEIIEREGDKWVRRSGSPQPETAEKTTILVFRDGQRREVRNYAVAGSTLWAFSEREATKFALSQLDLDATAKLNKARGVEFRLPPQQKAK